MANNSGLSQVTIIPSGGDDTKQIQDALTPGNTLNFSQEIFNISGTLNMVSNIIWNAEGATFQGGSANMIVNTGTIDNIQMNGGTYRGDGSTANRLVEFVCTNSQFSNMTIENTGHCFGITMGSSGNVCNKLTAKNSLNGLADRGENNTWNDCTSDSMTSDFFIIKCKNSTFNHCIITATKVMGAAGFGFYARIDGSNNVGAEISGNKFINCEAHNAGHAGFSLNCPSNGTNANIHDNSIQAICTGNAQGGLSFVNTSPGGINENNTFDILSYNNPGGGVVIKSGCNNNSGNTVAYSNASSDISNSGKNNNINAYHPITEQVPKISGTGVTVTDFDCKNPPPSPPFCVQAYCGPIPTGLNASLQISPSTISLNQSTTLTVNTTGGTGPYLYQWTNLPSPCTGDTTTSTIICTPDTKGTFNINVNVTDSSTPPKSAMATGTLIVNGTTNNLKVQLEVNPKNVKQHHKVKITTKVSGGTKPYSYEYTGLPKPCKAVNKDHIDCSPHETGTFNISVNVSDSKNNTGTDTHILTVSK